MICPFLLSVRCLLKNFDKLRNFVLVPHMSSKVHFCSMEGQTLFLLVNLWQLMTASNVGACTQAWQAKCAVLKILRFVCKCFLHFFPTPSSLSYLPHFLCGLWLTFLVLLLRNHRKCLLRRLSNLGFFYLLCRNKGGYFVKRKLKIRQPTSKPGCIRRFQR